MSAPVIDKISFSLVFFSLILFVYGWCVFPIYNGFNGYLAEYVSEILKAINPSSEPLVQQFEGGKSCVYEERVMLAVFILSAVLSGFSFIRLVVQRVNGGKVLTFASTFTLSFALVLCNIYIIFNSGLLLDL